jgi:hypothetical protein
MESFAAFERMWEEREENDDGRCGKRNLYYQWWWVGTTKLACFSDLGEDQRKQLQFLPSFLGLGPPSPLSLRPFPPSVPACLPACLPDSAHSPHRFRDKTRVRDLLTLLTGCLHSTRCTNRAIRCPPSSSIPNRPEIFSVVWITLIYIFLSLPPPTPRRLALFFLFWYRTRT